MRYFFLIVVAFSCALALESECYHCRGTGIEKRDCRYCKDGFDLRKCSFCDGKGTTEIGNKYSAASNSLHDAANTFKGVEDQRQEYLSDARSQEEIDQANKNYNSGLLIGGIIGTLLLVIIGISM